jgi:hypothetical protein
MPEIRDLLFDSRLDLAPPKKRSRKEMDPLDPHAIPGWCFRTCNPDIPLEHLDWDRDGFLRTIGKEQS